MNVNEDQDGKNQTRSHFIRVRKSNRSEIIYISPSSHKAVKF